MLEIGVIERAWRAFVAPIVFAAINNGLLCFCLDYRKLHTNFVRDSHTIEIMDVLIILLGNALVLSSHQTNRRFWQVKINDPDCDKSALPSHHGMLRFSRLSCRVYNAPGIIYRTMDVELLRMKWQFSLVYLDDTILFSSSADEHLSPGRTVLLIL